MFRHTAFLALIVEVFGLAPRAEAQAAPIPVKVVVADTGDRPGEFHHLVEGKKLDRVLPFPQATATCG